MSPCSEPVAALKAEVGGSGGCGAHIWEQIPLRGRSDT